MRIYTFNCFKTVALTSAFVSRLVFWKGSSPPQDCRNLISALPRMSSRFCQRRRCLWTSLIEHDEDRAICMESGQLQTRFNRLCMVCQLIKGLVNLIKISPWWKFPRKTFLRKVWKLNEQLGRSFEKIGHGSIARKCQTILPSPSWGCIETTRSKGYHFLAFSGICMENNVSHEYHKKFSSLFVKLVPAGFNEKQNLEICVATTLFVNSFKTKHKQMQKVRPRPGVKDKLYYVGIWTKGFHELQQLVKNRDLEWHWKLPKHRIHLLPTCIWQLLKV